MARNYRRRMLAPINTNKHFIPKTKATVATGVVAPVNIILSVARDAVNQTNEVEEGAIIKAVHCNYWLQGIGASGTLSQCVTVLEKIPANQASVDATEILNLQSYNNKKNILHTFQGLLGSQSDTNPIAPLNGWVLIPKGKQRFGLGDSLVYTVMPIGESLSICGMAIYKEYL